MLSRHAWGVIWIVIPVAVVACVVLAWVSVALARGADLHSAILGFVSFLPVALTALHVVLVALVWRGAPSVGTTIGHLIGFRMDRLAADLVSGVVVGLLMSVAVFAPIAAWFLPQTGWGPTPFPRWVAIWWLFVTALTASLGEELYLRGLILRAFADLPPAERVCVTIVPASAITLGLYAFWHEPPYAQYVLLHASVAGVIAGVFALRTNRLFPVIVAHAVADAIAGIVLIGH